MLAVKRDLLTLPMNFPAFQHYVDVVMVVGLRQAEEAGIQAAAVVKVELGRLVNDGSRVVAEAEIAAPAGMAPCTPYSMLSVSRSAVSSSAVIDGIPAGRPIPGS